jgi:hypothetical protein
MVCRSTGRASTTAGADVTVIIQNRSPVCPARIRVNGGSAAAGDALTSACMVLQPLEKMSLTLANGDEVFGTAENSDAGCVHAVIG